MYPDTYRNKEDDEAVYWFSSPFDALNNWSAHVVEAYGRTFMTLEHAYHYAKFMDNEPDIAKQVAAANSPWAAKQVAIKNQDRTRSDWFELNLQIMEDLFRAKVEQHPDVRDVLLRTGNRTIIENSPVDSFWGAGKDGAGQNNMGNIQMKVRDETRGK